jgi:hypothetical protein
MKHILFFVLTVSLLIPGCSSSKKAVSSIPDQGITGQLTELKGNRQPSPDLPPAKPRGIAGTVLVYEPTHISQVTRVGTSSLYTAISTKLVASVETDSTGLFTVALPVGSYSLFVKHKNGFYSNLFDSNNNIALFTVEEGKLTTANLVVSLKASF